MRRHPAAVHQRSSRAAQYLLDRTEGKSCTPPQSLDQAEVFAHSPTHCLRGDRRGEAGGERSSFHADSVPDDRRRARGGERGGDRRARDRQPGGGQRRGGQGEGWCKPKKRHARPFCPTSQGPRAMPTPGKGPMGGGGPVRGLGPARVLASALVKVMRETARCKAWRGRCCVLKPWVDGDGLCLTGGLLGRREVDHRDDGGADVGRETGPRGDHLGQVAIAPIPGGVGDLRRRSTTTATTTPENPRFCGVCNTLRVWGVSRLRALARDSRPLPCRILWRLSDGRLEVLISHLEVVPPGNLGSVRSQAPPCSSGKEQGTIKPQEPTVALPKDCREAIESIATSLQLMPRLPLRVGLR